MVLITLVTLVLARVIGQQLNAEVIGVRVWAGTRVILLGLAGFQWGRLRANGFTVARNEQPGAVSASVPHPGFGQNALPASRSSGLAGRKADSVW
ncbi:MAG: hypothetical protein KDI88_14415 [Gammaproteobacteria bacterium]|nr:hypothetical protein [Gammaproteobacteria bacterium]